MTKSTPNAGTSGARYDWSFVPRMVADGKTFAEIARAVGCSGPSVSDWMRRRGIKPPVTKQSTEERYGCTRAVARRLNNGAPLNTTGNPAAKYRDAWRNAEKRGIAWEMTFPEWMAVWDAAGGLAGRGTASSDLCMGRHGDVGPYKASNVSIITVRQNSQDGLQNKPRIIPPRKPGFGRGYFYDPRQTIHPYRVEVCGKYIGSYATQEEALRVYRAVAAQLTTTEAA